MARKGGRTPPRPAVPHDTLLEAVLFSAGKPLALPELAQASGIGEGEIRRQLAGLVKKWAAIPGAIELVPIGGKFAMQLRGPLNLAVAKVARVDLPRPVLKTLALVAYYQPMLQSELLRMLGPKVYEHVKELVDKGFVFRKPHGRSMILATTRLFPEYFGIAGDTRNAIKEWIAKQVGITIQKRDLTDKEKQLLKEIEQEETLEEASPSGPAPDGSPEGSPGEAADAGGGDGKEREGTDVRAKGPEQGEEREPYDEEGDGEDDEDDEDEEK